MQKKDIRQRDLRRKGGEVARWLQETNRMLADEEEQVEVILKQVAVSEKPG